MKRAVIIGSAGINNYTKIKEYLTEEDYFVFGINSLLCFPSPMHIFQYLLLQYLKELFSLVRYILKMHMHL